RNTSSIRSVSRQTSPSASRARASNVSRGGGKSPSHRSTDACCRNRSTASPGSLRVTNTCGIACATVSPPLTNRWQCLAASRLGSAAGALPRLHLGDARGALVRFCAGELRLVLRLAAGDLVGVHTVMPIERAQPLHHGKCAEHGVRGGPVELLQAEAADQRQR